MHQARRLEHLFLPLKGILLRKRRIIWNKRHRKHRPYQHDKQENNQHTCRNIIRLMPFLLLLRVKAHAGNTRANRRRIYVYHIIIRTLCNSCRTHILKKTAWNTRLLCHHIRNRPLTRAVADNVNLCNPVFLIVCRIKINQSGDRTGQYINNLLTRGEHIVIHMPNLIIHGSLHHHHALLQNGDKRILLLDFYRHYRIRTCVELRRLYHGISDIIDIRNVKPKHLCQLFISLYQRLFRRHNHNPVFSRIVTVTVSLYHKMGNFVISQFNRKILIDI